jgi:hypothetical protein
MPQFTLSAYLETERYKHFHSSARWLKPRTPFCLCQFEREHEKHNLSEEMSAQEYWPI